MDTNLFKLLMENTNVVKVLTDSLATRAPESPAASSSIALLITIVIVGAFAGVLGAIANWIQSRAIHKAVNSERTAMITKMDALTAEVLRITGENKTLAEHRRGAEVADALKTSTGRES